LKELPHMLSTCWLLFLHSAFQLILNHLNRVEVRWMWRPGHLMQHTCGDHPFTYSASHNDRVGSNQNANFWTHQIKGHISTGLMSIACVSWPKQVFLLVSFRSGFFAAIWPWRSDSRSLLWTVDAVSVTWTLWSIYLGWNVWGW
jgi:hypothetical protein